MPVPLLPESRESQWPADLNRRAAEDFLKYRKRPQRPKPERKPLTDLVPMSQARHGFYQRALRPNPKARFK